MVIADSHGLPIAAGIASASPHEATLAEATLDQIVLDHAPERLIGDLSWVLRSAIGENSGHGIGDQRGRLLRIMGHPEAPELRRGRNGLLECTTTPALAAL